MTKGQIDDMLCKKVTAFYPTVLGVGPEEAHVYIVHDMVIVRLKGKLLPIEKKLLESKQGINLVKDIRKTFHELLTDHLGTIVSDIVKHTVISAHSDISTKTGEQLQVFIPVHEKSYRWFSYRICVRINCTDDNV